jgi:hypothetical protein
VGMGLDAESTEYLAEFFILIDKSIMTVISEVLEKEEDKEMTKYYDPSNKEKDNSKDDNSDNKSDDDATNTEL